MENKRRKISLCRMISFTGIFLITCSAVVSKGQWHYYFNIPSLIITFGLTFFLLLLNFGKDFVTFIPDSLMTLLSAPPEPVPKYKLIAKAGSRYVIGAGCLVTLRGLIQVLVHIDDPSLLGPAIAVLLLPVFYAVLLSELFFSYMFKAYSS